MPLTGDEIVRALGMYDERQTIAGGVQQAHAKIEPGDKGTFEITFVTTMDVWKVNRTFLVDYLLYCTRAALGVREFQIDSRTLEIKTDNPTLTWVRGAEAKERIVTISGHFDRSVQKSQEDRIKEALEQAQRPTDVTPKGPFVEQPPGKRVEDNVYYVGIDPVENANSTFFGMEVRGSVDMPPGTFSIGPIEVKPGLDGIGRVGPLTEIMKRARERQQAQQPPSQSPSDVIKKLRERDWTGWSALLGTEEDRRNAEIEKAYRYGDWASKKYAEIKFEDPYQNPRSPKTHYHVTRDGRVLHNQPGPKGEEVVGTFRGKPVTQHDLDKIVSAYEEDAEEKIQPWLSERIKEQMRQAYYEQQILPPNPNVRGYLGKWLEP
jgi:hypothetical protein